MLIKNEGLIDRLSRFLLAEILAILAWFWLAGTIQIIAYILAAIMLVTAVLGFCGLYQILGINTNKRAIKKRMLVIVIAILIFIAVAVAGIYYSLFFTKKIFLEDYNKMNNYYKQTLFNTGQEKRTESITNYDQLVHEYAIFSKKYTTYRPQAIKSDDNFNNDLVKVEILIGGLKDKVYTGDLKSAHTDFEAVRPIFQDILKRNNFSLLAVYLVDFHDSMEKVIEEADKKNANGVITTYVEADEKLKAVEEVANDEEIVNIRTKLNTLLETAKNGSVENLSAQAAELKSSFVKVYLKRG